MEKEIIKEIIGTDYLVSNLGNVFSDKRWNYRLKLKPTTDKNGYKIVTLMIDGNRCTKKVHRLVASVFIPNTNNYPQVHHKNENKADNNSDNLSWVTAKQNSNLSNAKSVGQFTKEGVLVKEWNSATQAQNEGGFRSRNISKCCRNRPKYKSHKGFIWKFI